MRYLFTFFICLNTTITVVWSQPAKVIAVLETETKRFDAMVRKDTVFLKKLLTDDLVYIHSNGLTENKTEHLHAVGTGSIAYKTMERASGVNVRQYGKWAITNGLVHATGLLNGKPFDIQLRYTAIYRRQKRKWRLVNWQSTRV